MSLLYRAMWQADAAQLIVTAHREFSEWVSGKHPQLEVPDDGESDGPGADIRITEGSSDEGHIKRWVLHEDDQHDRWITTMTAVHERRVAEGWLWIDVEHVSQSYLDDAVDVAAPRLARKLLAALPSSHHGPLKLQSKEYELGPNEMAHFIEQLKHPDRQLPIVVFSPNYQAARWISIQRAKRAAGTLAGVCQVHLLDPRGEDEFRAKLGRDLGVWSGACRVYMPRLVADSSDPRQHRYFLSRHLGRRALDAGFKIARYLSPLITRQRAPSAYVKFRHLLDTDYEAQIDELFHEWDRQTQHNEQLERQLRTTEDSYIDALAEIEDLNVLQAHTQHNLAEAWRAAEAIGARSAIENHLHDEPAEEDAADLELPESCSQAAELARRHLHKLSFPEAACHDLSRLDQAIESSAWAKTAWRGFVALDTYAQSATAGGGGFYHWCVYSGESSWSASAKKLAMVESESVRQDDTLRAARQLPVDPRVDPSGRIFMEAHLKVSEGGGPLAPRIYFFDDTGGDTGKVHIGFFGPHDHMPNKSTN